MVSTNKSAYKKIGALIHSLKFLVRLKFISLNLLAY